MFGKKKQQIVVKQYTGHKAAHDFQKDAQQKDAQQMARQGYTVVSQSENKLSGGILGVFNQHITVTYQLMAPPQRR